MLVDDLLTPVLPVRVQVVHVVGHGSRPVERDERGDVVERRRREPAHERSHRAALELEDPDRVAPRQHREDLLVVERQVVEIGPLTGPRLDEVARALEDREVAEPEEVDLEQPERLDAVHLVLGDDRRVVDPTLAVGLALDGQVLDERLFGDHDGRGVDAVLAPQALEATRHLDGSLDRDVLVAHPSQLGRGGVAVLMLGELLEARGQRGVATHDERRHRLGDPVPQGVVVAEDPRGVAHGRARLDGRERHDLGDVVGAVALRGVLDDLRAVPLVEVEIDVGHLFSARVQESLEHQVVADRVEVDDAQAVRDTAARRGPSSGADTDLGLTSKSDEVPHDEEVRGEPHLRDHRELVVEPLAHDVGDRLAVASLRALEGELTQVDRRALLVGRTLDAIGHLELGQRGTTELDLDVRSLGDEQGVVARVDDVSEEMAHLRGGLEVVLLSVEPESLLVVEERPGLHAQQRVMRRRVVASRVVAVVGREQRRAELARDLDQLWVRPALLVEAVVLQLDEERVPAEDLLESRRALEPTFVVACEQRLEHDATEAAARRDEPLVVARQQLPVHPRLVVVALEERRRGELEQVGVAEVVLGEEGEVVVELAAFGVTAGVVDATSSHGPLVSRLERHVRLGADDRRDTARSARLVEVEDAVEVPVVGDAERWLAVGDGGRHQLVDPRRAIEHRELGVGVQVDEARRHLHPSRRLADYTDVTPPNLVPGRDRIRGPHDLSLEGADRGTRPRGPGATIRGRCRREGPARHRGRAAGGVAALRAVRARPSAGP